MGPPDRGIQSPNRRQPARLGTFLPGAGPVVVVRQFLERFGLWFVIVASLWLTWRLWDAYDFNELWNREGTGGMGFWLAVDIAAGEKAVELIKEHVRSTFRSEVVGDIGGFGGLFSLAKIPYRDPLLVSSTDGVGTKSVIAAEVGRFDTIGIDVVAMSVDDIAAHGAEPLFFLDYISVGKLVPEHIDQIVQGVARGCREAGCALLGGEMSEHPGVMAAGEFDLVIEQEIDPMVAPRYPEPSPEPEPSKLTSGDLPGKPALSDWPDSRLPRQAGWRKQQSFWRRLVPCSTTGSSRNSAAPAPSPGRASSHTP